MSPAAFTRSFSDSPASAALQSIVIFWLFYFLMTTMRALVFEFDELWAMAERRLVVALLGAGFCWVIYQVMRPMSGRPLAARARVMFLACLPAAAIFAWFNYFIFYVYEPLASIADEAWVKQVDAKMLVQIILDGTIMWYWFFATWAAFHLAIGYAAEVRAAERKIAAYRAEAQTAQLRALRYQVNPHFLFNTLNSLSSLVLHGRNEEAERMILNLSTFLRSSLTGGGREEIRLGDEVEQQALYLEVEKARFGDRLRFTIDMADDTASVMVPSMILQPLVENAVKYAVAPSRDPVCIEVRSYREGGRIFIYVEDDGGFAPEKVECGLGTGLRNVKDRLTTRYGTSADFMAGPRPEGGFRVRLSWRLGPHE